MFKAAFFIVVPQWKKATVLVSSGGNRNWSVHTVGTAQQPK